MLNHVLNEVFHEKERKNRSSQKGWVRKSGLHNSSERGLSMEMDDSWSRCAALGKKHGQPPISLVAYEIERTVQLLCERAEGETLFSGVSLALLGQGGGGAFSEELEDKYESVTPQGRMEDLGTGEWRTQERIDNRGASILGGDQGKWTYM